MKCYLSIFVIFSLIMSAISLAVALPRYDNLGFDYLGIIVSIISLATAFAVGFQIWNALSLDNRLKGLKTQVEKEYSTKMDSLEKRLKVDYNNRVADLSTMVSFSTSIISADMSINNYKYNLAFMAYIRALGCETSISKNSDINLEASSVPMLKKMIDSMPVCITDKEEQKYIIKTILDSGNEELIDRIVKIKNDIFYSEN